MLVLRGISKIFHPGTTQEVRALDNINIEISPGEFVVVIGTNGSGKSSLLNIVAGAYGPDSGSITIDDHHVEDTLEHERAGLIGRVFQDPFKGTAAHLTVEGNLALASKRGETRGLKIALNDALRREFRERVRELGLDLEERLQYRMGNLSGGQRQALTLLMATWKAPKVLLLDEHAAALDPRSAEVVMDLTRRLVTKHGITTIMVTHSMQHAVRFGDRLLMMHRGKIVKDYSGADKQRLRTAELVGRFDQMRKQELMDESVAELLRTQYV